MLTSYPRHHHRRNLAASGLVQSVQRQVELVSLLNGPRQRQQVDLLDVEVAASKGVSDVPVGSEDWPWTEQAEECLEQPSCVSQLLSVLASLHLEETLQISVLLLQHDTSDVQEVLVARPILNPSLGEAPLALALLQLSRTRSC